MEAVAALELSTVLVPQAFLALACTANLAKNLAAVAASATRAPIYRTFARQNNMADITAKGGFRVALGRAECWERRAGIAAGRAAASQAWAGLSCRCRGCCKARAGVGRHCSSAVTEWKLGRWA